MSVESNMSEQKGRARSVETLNVSGARIAIIASRFNAFVVDRLVTGAQAALTAHGVNADAITTLRVPGAYELPLAANALAKRGDYDAVVALGAVIRGETAHFDFVCSECSSGLMRVSLDFNMPIGFGVLTVDTEAQALARASDQDNKGAEAAEAALEMITLLRCLHR